jgi:hypothetical protein
MTPESSWLKSSKLNAKTMIRFDIAVVVGVIVWILCATALDILLRFTLPGYAAAEPGLHFTLSMMIARLALPSAVPSIVAGFVGTWSARGNRRAALVLGFILLLAFLPAHYRLWTQFPLWYHLTFLASLPLLTLLGATLHSPFQSRTPNTVR